jgi:N-carbamoyl-L-amino-acid hydrolase
MAAEKSKIEDRDRSFDHSIDPERFQADFEELAAIGATPDGGVDRPALSDAHLEARQWFLRKAEEAGLPTRIDAAGNHIAIARTGPEAKSRSLLLGSHLDSVPQGGRFDGALGVTAGLAVLRTIKESAIPLPFDLELYDFTDEEGYFVGLMGSQALAGLLKPSQLRTPGQDSGLFLDALERAGVDVSRILEAARDPATLAGYLELHIEQGLRLVEAEVDLGIVTSIVGIRSFRLHFIGRADHAGTTPLEKRFDAGLGASAFHLASHQHVGLNHPGCVVTVGDMGFSPGAFNVVPKTASVALEFRAGTDDELDALESEILNIAAEQAGVFGLALEVDKLERAAPVRMDPGFQRAAAQASETLGLKSLPLSSGAGHDAQSLAQVCPAGLIFIPSTGGFSHSPRESSEWSHCVHGANALLHSVLALAEDVGGNASEAGNERKEP